MPKNGHWRSSVVPRSKHVTDAIKLLRVLKESLGCGGRIIYQRTSNQLVQSIQLQCPPRRLAQFFETKPEFACSVSFYSGMSEEKARLQCLLHFTLVLTGPGKTVRARDLVQGSHVISGRGERAIYVQQKHVFRKCDRDIVHIEFQTNEGDEGVLKITADHCMLVSGSAQNIPCALTASELKPGMHVVGSDGDVAAKVTGVLTTVEQTYAVMVALDDPRQTFMIADASGAGLPVLGDSSLHITLKHSNSFLEYSAMTQNVHPRPHSAAPPSRQPTEIEKEARKLRKALKYIGKLEERQSQGETLPNLAKNKLAMKAVLVRQLTRLGNP